MITGNKPRKVRSYLPIDHNGDVFGPVYPREGERFIGHPYGRYTDNSAPFIEVVKNNQLVRAVNALDLAEIEFAEGEPADP